MDSALLAQLSALLKAASSGRQQQERKSVSNAAQQPAPSWAPGTSQPFQEPLPSQQQQQQLTGDAVRQLYQLVEQSQQQQRGSQQLWRGTSPLPESISHEGLHHPQQHQAVQEHYSKQSWSSQAEVGSLHCLAQQQQQQQQHASRHVGVPSSGLSPPSLQWQQPGTYLKALQPSVEAANSFGASPSVAELLMVLHQQHQRSEGRCDKSAPNRGDALELCSVPDAPALQRSQPHPWASHSSFVQQREGGQSEGAGSPSFVPEYARADQNQQHELSLPCQSASFCNPCAAPSSHPWDSILPGSKVLPTSVKAAPAASGGVNDNLKRSLVALLANASLLSCSEKALLLAAVQRQLQQPHQPPAQPQQLPQPHQPPAQPQQLPSPTAAAHQQAVLSALLSSMLNLRQQAQRSASHAPPGTVQDTQKPALPRCSSTPATTAVLHLDSLLRSQLPPAASAPLQPPMTTSLPAQEGQQPQLRCVPCVPAFSNKLTSDLRAKLEPLLLKRRQEMEDVFQAAGFTPSLGSDHEATPFSDGPSAGMGTPSPPNSPKIGGVPPSITEPLGNTRETGTSTSLLPPAPSSTITAAITQEGSRHSIKSDLELQQDGSDKGDAGAAGKQEESKPVSAACKGASPVAEAATELAAIPSSVNAAELWPSPFDNVSGPASEAVVNPWHLHAGLLSQRGLLPPQGSSSVGVEVVVSGGVGEAGLARGQHHHQRQQQQLHEWDGGRPAKAQAAAGLEGVPSPGGPYWGSPAPPVAGTRLACPHPLRCPGSQPPTLSTWGSQSSQGKVSLLTFSGARTPTVSNALASTAAAARAERERVLAELEDNNEELDGGKCVGAEPAVSSPVAAAAVSTDLGTALNVEDRVRPCSPPAVPSMHPSWELPERDSGRVIPMVFARPAEAAADVPADVPAAGTSAAAKLGSPSSVRASPPQAQQQLKKEEGKQRSSDSGVTESLPGTRVEASSRHVDVGSLHRLDSAQWESGCGKQLAGLSNSMKATKQSCAEPGQSNKTPAQHAQAPAQQGLPKPIDGFLGPPADCSSPFNASSPNDTLAVAAELLLAIHQAEELPQAPPLQHQPRRTPTPQRPSAFTEVRPRGGSSVGPAAVGATTDPSAASHFSTASPGVPHASAAGAVSAPNLSVGGVGGQPTSARQKMEPVGRDVPIPGDQLNHSLDAHKWEGMCLLPPRGPLFRDIQPLGGAAMRSDSCVEAAAAAAAQNNACSAGSGGEPWQKSGWEGGPRGDANGRSLHGPASCGLRANVGDSKGGFGGSVVGPAAGVQQAMKRREAASSELGPGLHFPASVKRRRSSSNPAVQEGGTPHCSGTARNGVAR